jgi:hypothetical protein
VPGLDVEGGPDDTGLVVLFDVGGGYHTAVDIDLQMPVTLIATHHHCPPACEEYGWRAGSVPVTSTDLSATSAAH